MLPFIKSLHYKSMIPESQFYQSQKCWPTFPTTKCVLNVFCLEVYCTCRAAFLWQISTLFRVKSPPNWCTKSKYRLYENTDEAQGRKTTTSVGNLRSFGRFSLQTRLLGTDVPRNVGDFVLKGKVGGANKGAIHAPHRQCSNFLQTCLLRGFSRSQADLKLLVI